ncbi:MAG: pyridoxamine 5'-phosphate oxidase family protein [Acidobacteriota bacterium]|nr:pyridoxamine 5'-phosphate oxidase family protein [Acidobacteriota bacterium]
MSMLEATERTRVRRLPKRAVYDKAQIYSILDEGFVCHLGFVAGGQPYVIPTGYARVDDTIYLHGSTASRMVRTAAEGIDVCVTVTLVDGFVLARSAFHHSMNYRSVVVLGKARLVTERDEKWKALQGFTNHIVPGRWEEARQPSEQELKGTSVLALPIEEASAKVRTGGPIDDEEDYALPLWAGVVPIQTRFGEPIKDERVPEGVRAIDMGRFKKS